MTPRMPALVFLPTQQFLWIKSPMSLCRTLLTKQPMLSRLSRMFILNPLPWMPLMDELITMVLLNNISTRWPSLEMMMCPNHLAAPLNLCWLSRALVYTITHLPGVYSLVAILAACFLLKASATFNYNFSFARTTFSRSSSCLIICRILNARQPSVVSTDGGRIYLHIIIGKGMT
jgi:hypothetical protein